MAATTIQCWLKSLLTHRRFQSDLKNIIAVQSTFRRWSACRLLATRVNALRNIQVISRQYLVRCRAKKEVVKMRNARQMRNVSAIKIQSFARVYFAKSFANRERAAIQIQKTWRCFSVHVDYLLAIIDITSIQNCVRRYLERKATAAIAIQRHVRGYLDRIDIRIKDFATSEIQRTWRGYTGRAISKYRSTMVLKLQSVFRRRICIRAVQLLKIQTEVERRFQDSKAKVIQKAMKEYCLTLVFERTAKVIQRATRGYLAKTMLRQRIRNLKLIQAYCRSFLVRCRRSKKVLHIARRVATANMHAIRNPSLVLGERTKAALYELRTSKRLTEITDAAITLEMSTRLSRKCCTAFVEVDAPSILYELLGTCNRSLPHVEIVHIVLLTLRNVSKHQDLLNNVATPESCDVMLDLVQMFRDKDDIFLVAIIILSRLLRHNKTLKESCSRSENLKRLSHVLKKISPSNGDPRFSVNTHITSKRKQGIKTLRNIISFLRE